MEPVGKRAGRSIREVVALQVGESFADRLGASQIDEFSERLAQVPLEFSFPSSRRLLLKAHGYYKQPASAHPGVA